jgi:hypothetical protein
LADSNDHGYDNRSPQDRSLRVGDKERDAVVEILRMRHMEGRLDADEFQTRIDRCLAAKTYAELDALLADFPREEADPRRARQRAWRPWPLAFPILPLALVGAIVFGAHIAWLAVPLLVFYVFVVRPLRWHTGGGYAGGPWACGPRRTRRI